MQFSIQAMLLVKTAVDFRLSKHKISFIFYFQVSKIRFVFSPIRRIF